MEQDARHANVKRGELFNVINSAIIEKSTIGHSGERVVIPLHELSKLTVNRSGECDVVVIAFQIALYTLRMIHSTGEYRKLSECLVV